MKIQLGFLFLATATMLSMATMASAQYAIDIVSYDEGTGIPIEFGTNLPYNLASKAIGEPARHNGDGVVSVFSGPYKRKDIVSVGEAGHLTLRLSNYAIPQAGSPEIGVFENIGLSDFDYPNGLAGSPAAFFGANDALVEVSEYGSSWVSLGLQTFGTPSNGYTDLTDAFSPIVGLGPSDFQKPFIAPLNSFDGLPYYDAGGSDILSILDGSGGGTWLDISSTGLAKVGFIRFSVADDGINGMGSPDLSFELDAVSIATNAVGATTPEPSTLVLLLLATPFVTRRR